MSKQQFITALQAAELRDQDNYPQFDANNIELDRLSQWIEEEAAYTDFVVIHGNMHASRIAELEQKGYTVHVMHVPRTVVEWVTMIVWPTI